MGRLRRDPRAIGLFPSNFVKVLDESFQPAPNSRNASPLSLASANASPAKSKSVFRKPFQAYEVLGYKDDAGGTKENTPPKVREEKKKMRPYSSMRTAVPPGGTIKKTEKSPVKDEPAFRVPSPPPRRHARRESKHHASPASAFRGEPSASPTPTPTNMYGRTPSPAPTAMYRAASPAPSFRPVSPRPQSMYRAASPAPSQHRPVSPLPQSYHDGSAYPQLLPSSRGPSPAPQEDYFSHSRAPSPAPSFQPQYHSRAPSPSPYDDDIGSSPPPPPPPAHRVVYQPRRAPSPAPCHIDPQTGDMYENGIRTPVPPSPSGGSHTTPSPLRDAMNDVMSSLHDMSILQQDSPTARPETPPDVWSPDAFDQVRTQSRQQMRPQSTLGFARHEERYQPETRSKTPSLPSSRDGPPELNNYVTRMEHKLRHAHSSSLGGPSEMFLQNDDADQPPAPPLKGSQYGNRPTTAGSHSSSDTGSRFGSQRQKLRHRKSAYELGKQALGRTFTTKTNATNSTNSSSNTQSSNSTQLTSRSIMSGYSAGGFSATSAGSLARRKFGMGSLSKRHNHTKSVGDISSSARSLAESRPGSQSGFSYHESHASQPAVTPTADWTANPMESAGILGGLGAPRTMKKSGFFKKMIESARTGAANARSTIGSASSSRPGSRAGSPVKSLIGGGNGITAIAGGTSRPGSAFGAPNAARDMGLGAGNDWMQVRRDVNRSNSLSKNERNERAERCEMLELPALSPIELLHELAEGDEGLDGLPISEPTDFNTPNLALVDKSTRFISSLPPMTTAMSLAQNYVCRPHRSDVQRLRAIFTWVAERITWEEDFEGAVDTRRVIQTKRGCSEEIAVLVHEMCSAVGLHAEVVRGYLRAPGEVLDLDTLAHANHWWNAVIVDGEWRVMDCSLAGPTNPRRSAYSSASSQVAECWYFLARPMEACYTHIPLLPEQQHISPPIEPTILVSLPCACPAYFRNKTELTEFDTSLLHLENLEMAYLHLFVPEDVECVAETEAKAFAQDGDGDFFESGEVVRKKALAQAEWVGGRKRYTIKALLPGDEGQGMLKIYAGKRGLMVSFSRHVLSNRTIALTDC